MAGIEAVVFATQISQVCLSSPIVRSYAVTIEDNVLVKVRADLRPVLFIDVFHNVETGKTAFALIEQSH